MGGMRQSIAASIIFLSILYINTSKLISFFIILIATLFHYSAAIFLLVYILAIILRVRFIFGIIIVIVLLKLLDIKFTIFNLPYMGDVDLQEFSNLKDILIIVERVMSLGLLFFLYKNNLKNNENSILFKIALFNLIIFISFYDVARILAGRGSLMLRIAEVFLWARAAVLLKNLKYFYPILFIYVLIKTFITFDQDYYSNYKNFFINY
jgi:hypothetical protein